MDRGTPTTLTSRPPSSLPRFPRRPLPGPSRIHAKRPPCTIPTSSVSVLSAYHRPRLPRRLLGSLPTHCWRHHCLPSLRLPLHPLTRPPPVPNELAMLPSIT